VDPLVIPFLTYALVTTFTPGPNNISASTVGMRLGYRRMLLYLLGMSAGFLPIMLASGLLTDLAGRVYQGVVPWLKWVGVAYMTWLAVSLFLPSRHGEEGEKARNARFLDGLLLQIVNVKVILYGITIYSSFHHLLSRSTALLVASAVFLAALGFLSVSLWALTGATFSRLLKSAAARLVFNIVMALLLAYSAVEIVLH
jgi:threonine/homoserine/homoserine lactone efflux protein